MLDLNKRGPDLRRYVASLEAWIIATLARFNVTGERREDRIGVWVRRPEKAPLPDGRPAEDKIAAIGIRVRRWVTFHGISLNVDPDLEHYSGIVPCGVSGYGVTSLVDLGIPVSMAEVDAVLKAEFERLFGATASPCSVAIDGSSGELMAEDVDRAGRFVLAATVLASAMAFIDGSVVMIALPVIQKDFGATFQELQWIVNAYTLMLGALILIAGALGDRVGRRRVFVIGIAIFAVASLACAIATGSLVMIAARAVQGVGAALLVPQSLAIISASFPRETRGRAIGVWAAASAITTSLGPPLGGFLIDTLSWRVAFLINLPLSAVALWLTFTHVPESRDEKASGPLDWLGSALAAFSLGALTYALTELSDENGGGLAALVGLALGSRRACRVLVRRATRQKSDPAGGPVPHARHSSSSTSSRCSSMARSPACSSSCPST